MNEEQMFELEALKQILTDADEFQFDIADDNEAKHVTSSVCSGRRVKGYFKVDFDVIDTSGDGLNLEAYQLVRRHAANTDAVVISDNRNSGAPAQRAVRRVVEVSARDKSSDAISSITHDNHHVNEQTRRDARALELLERSDNVLFLPPLIVRFELPDDYPNEAPPALALSCSWLSLHHIRLLHKICMREWENVRGPILFHLYSILRHEALDKIFSLDAQCNTLLFVPHQAVSTLRSGCGKMPSKLLKLSKEMRNVIVCSDAGGLINKLLTFDRLKKREKLEQCIQECAVCYGQDKFSNGFELSLCKHWFCRKCVGEYVKMHIQEGSVTSLKCMNDSCDKEIISGDVQKLASADDFAKYDSILLNVALSSMDDVIYCPRKWCQAAVLKDPDDKDAQCPACQFVFCLRCRRCNHGINPCPITGDIRRLAEQYEQADAVERERLEKQFGRVHMLDAVHTIRSQSWIDSNSKQCPNCKASTEKFDGCNKIHCTKCSASWCWLCSRVLDMGDPYKHYRDPKQSQCYQQLFRGLVDFDELGNRRDDDAGHEVEFEFVIEGDDDDDDGADDDNEDDDDDDDDAEDLRHNLMQVIRAVFGDIRANGRG